MLKLKYLRLLSIIMTISSTLLALVLMPLCLWIYSRAWINTPVVDLLPFGAITLTLCSTLIPIGLGVLLRYRHTRVADMVLKVREVTLWLFKRARVRKRRNAHFQRRRCGC